MNRADGMVRAFERAGTDGSGNITDTTQGLIAVLEVLDPLTYALLALGRTEKDVARRLRDAGIRGRRQNMHHDPIGRWLVQVGFHAPAIFVNPDGTGITVNAGGWVNIAAPPAVVEFVRAFDDGAYPDLAEDN